MTAASDGGAAGPVECARCKAELAAGQAFCARCGTATSASVVGQDPLIGTVIEGRFRIISRLGQGGMGAVYEAEHTVLGKRVAVKVLRSDLRANAELGQRFRREAMVVSRLTDPHTVTVFDYGVTDGLAYIVMEYLRGEDLARLLDRETRLAPARALAIAHQICSSLAEAHEVGLVHRDLKPENVFIIRAASGEERVKVLDFGLAKLLGGLLDRDDPAAFTTAHGALMGTPYFMAPEQVRGEAIDGRTDLYALGALLYRMIAGEYPHRGRTPVEVLESHLSGVFRPLHELVQVTQVPLPEGCERLVHQLLAVDQKDRPASAFEVSRALVDISTAAAQREREVWSHTTWEGRKPDLEPDVEGPTRDEIEAFERGMRRSALLRTLTAVFVVAGLAVGGWFFAHRADPPLRREVEPNDKTEQANRVTPGVELSGYLGRRVVRDQSDRDVFRVEAPPGSKVAVELTGVPGLDAVVEGFDGGAHPVFKSDSGKRGEGERVASVVVPEDGLYLLVREVWVLGTPPSENSTDAYVLRVRAVDPGEGP